MGLVDNPRLLLRIGLFDGSIGSFLFSQVSQIFVNRAHQFSNALIRHGGDHKHRDSQIELRQNAIGLDLRLFRTQGIELGEYQPAILMGDTLAIVGKLALNHVKIFHRITVVDRRDVQQV